MKHLGWFSLIGSEILSPEIRLKVAQCKPPGTLPHAGMFPGLHATTFGLAIHAYSKQLILLKRNKELGC